MMENQPTHVVVINRDDPKEVLAWWPLHGPEAWEDGKAWEAATGLARLGDNRVGYARYVDGDWVV